MKKKIIVCVVTAILLVSALYASGHISSQKAKCSKCSCTYFSCDHDEGGHCYCKCGHSWRAHD